jgi:signal transduction histidine kinase
MSWLAVALLAWTAIASYACLFHGALYLQRRGAAREHLAFAITCATHVVYHAGVLVQLGTDEVRDAARGIELQLAGGVWMGAAFLQFAVAMSASRLARLVPLAWIASTLSAALSLLGLGVGTGDASVQAAGFGLDAERLHPPLATVGIVTSFLSLIWATAGLVTLIRHPRDRDEARIMLAVAIPIILLSVWTVVAATTGEPLGWASELTNIPIALACSFVLLRRFAGNAARLGAQSVALEQSYEQLRRTQDAMVHKEQLAAVGELSAVIAHEVRNPLAILKNAVSALRQRAIGAEDHRVLLGIVNEETERLARLVRDLLAYARPLSPSRSPTRLRELIELAWSDGRLARARGEATLDLDIPPRTAVMVDRNHAAHAIANVLENALVANAGQGTVRVRAEPVKHGDGAHIAIEIADDGPGMEPAVLAKAREPFFTTRPAGTGLGLAIVERVVRGHDGTLELESTPGAGTRVRLSFPAWDGRTPTSEPPAIAPRSD